MLYQTQSVLILTSFTNNLPGNCVKSPHRKCEFWTGTCHVKIVRIPAGGIFISYQIWKFNQGENLRKVPTKVNKTGTWRGKILDKTFLINSSSDWLLFWKVKSLKTFPSSNLSKHFLERLLLVKFSIMNCYSHHFSPSHCWATEPLT